MTEKIIIENFAGIKHLEMTLEEINIIIGPQASGKSICAKALYFFKSIFTDISNLIEMNFEKRKFDNSILVKFGEYFPQKFIGDKDFELSYFLNDNFIKVCQISGKRKISYSESYSKHLVFLRTEYKKILENQKNLNDIERRYPITWKVDERSRENLLKVIGKESTLSQIFIPAGRSFFALLQKNIFSFLSSNRTIDPFLIRFGSYYETVKEYISYEDNIGSTKKVKKISEDIEKIKKEILHGTFTQERDNDFIITEDGRKVGLASTSSGQQESLPLTILLGRVSTFFGFGGSTVYIEEPEAHIFPDAQKKIVELIAYIFNSSDRNMQFIITTHSPYVLTSFNNLILAGSVGMTENSRTRKKVNELVTEKIWLNTEDICAYSIHDGISECIKSKETGLIDSKYLDNVSNIIGGIFDKLIELS